MNRSDRRSRLFQPQAESCEPRLVLSTTATVHALARFRVLAQPGGESHPDRPNTPVLPYGNTTPAASFLDPSSKIVSGNTITLGRSSYVAPFASLDGTAGYIKIGSNSAILDNAVVQPNPGRVAGTPGVSIGDKVAIGPGAVVTGASTIGVFGSAAQFTSVGPNAVVNGATIGPGAIVGALAKIDPGVTVPANVRVLPGMHLTNDAQASDPTLGMVTPVTPADRALISAILVDTSALAPGYAALYQGQVATGIAGNPNNAIPVTSLYNGNLTTVEGASQEPGSTVVSFEPSRRGPKFLNNRGILTMDSFYQFPARVIGQVNISQRPNAIVKAVGKNNSIRGDEGQPITIGSLGKTGRNVTIKSEPGTTSGSTTTAPVNPSGSLTVGNNLVTGSNVVLLGGPGTANVLGDNVTIGDGSVVERSSIGSNSTIGSGSYIEFSTLPANSNISPGSIVINNRLVGIVQA